MRQAILTARRSHRSLLLQSRHQAHRTRASHERIPSQQAAAADRPRLPRRACRAVGGAMQPTARRGASARCGPCDNRKAESDQRRRVFEPGRVMEGRNAHRKPRKSAAMLCHMVRANTRFSGDLSYRPVAADEPDRPNLTFSASRSRCPIAMYSALRLTTCIASLSCSPCGRCET